MNTAWQGKFDMVQDQEAQKSFHPCTGSKACHKWPVSSNRTPPPKTSTIFPKAPPNGDNCSNTWNYIRHFLFKPLQTDFHKTITKCLKSRERNTIYAQEAFWTPTKQIRSEKNLPISYCHSNRRCLENQVAIRTGSSESPWFLNRNLEPGDLETVYFMVWKKAANPNY